MNERRLAPALSLVLFVALMSPGGDADAQPAPPPPRNPAAAEKLFNEAVAWEDKGAWDKACPLYEASNKSDPSVGAQMNVGRCAEHFGKIATAWAEFQKTRVLNRETLGSERKAEVEKFLDEADARLGPKLPYATIDVSARPPGLRVTDNGAELPVESLGKSLPLDPGKHEIVVTAPDFLEERQTLEVAPAGKAELVITLRPAPKKPATPPPVDAGSSVQLSVGISIGAAGALSLIGAAITGGLAGAERAKLDQLITDGKCDKVGDTEDLACDEASLIEAQDATDLGQALGTTTTAMLFTGIGLAAVGVIVAVTAPTGADSSEPAAAAPVSFFPILSPTTQGLFVQGQF